MIVSERIFLMLNQKQMSQKEFAERTGISQSTISDWKRKKTNPSVDKILKICEVLQVTPYELLAENVDEKGKCMDYDIALNKDEHLLLEGYRKLEKGQRERLLGYLSALKDIR